MRVALFAPHAVLPRGASDLTVGPARVVVEGTRIASVTPAATPEPGDDVLDGYLLTPAFCDLHTHVALVALRGAAVGAAEAGNVVEDLFFHVERRLTAEDVAAFAHVGAQEALLHGTGFIADHYYHAPHVARALADVGMTGMVAPTLQDLAGPGAAGADAALTDTVALHEDARLRAAEVHAAVGPHAVDTVSDDLWRRAHALAQQLGVPLHAHVAQSIEEVERLAARAGDTPLGHLRRLGVLDHASWLIVHLLYATDADLDALDDRHTLVLCPSSQAQFGFQAPVHRWLARGRRVAVATDCAASNDAMSLPKELRAVAALRVATIARTPLADRYARHGALTDARAMAADRSRQWGASDALGACDAALWRVWGAASSLHPRAPVGRIADGHLANLALWRLDHPSLWPATDPLRALTYGDPQPALAQLMTAGTWRTARGAHHTLVDRDDWRAARAEARARLARLLA